MVGMDTDTVAGVLFSLVGLSMFAQLVFNTAVEIYSIWYVVLGIGFLTIGSIFVFRDRNTIPTSDRNIVFPLVAVLLFVVGMGIYFYI